MEEKKPFAMRLEAFFAGKGFYAVLFLCLAIIGVSAWSLISGGEAGGLDSSASIAVASMEEHPVAVGRTDANAVGGQSAQQSTKLSEPELIKKVPPSDTAADASAEDASAAAVPAEAEQTPADDYYIWPVIGELAAAHSVDMPVWNPTMQDWRTHDGIDIAAALGTQVKAAANGKVTEVYDDDLGGTTVVISHRNGLQSSYSNLAEVPAVGIGDQVCVGQVIGAVGDTALGESGQVCHLHFAMTENGVSVDPAAYLP